MTKPICRDSQIEMLSHYLGLSDDEDQEEEEVTLPEVLLVQGVGGTGKTVTLQWIFSQYLLNHAVVDCIECYQPKLIFQVIFPYFTNLIFFLHATNPFQSILAQLSSEEDSSSIKCDNVSDFTRMLMGIVGDKKAVIHLENGDRLRDDLSLLSVFTRIQEITGCNVTSILETRLDWSKLRPSEDVITPVRVHFSQYSRDELVRLVAGFLETEISIEDEKESVFRLQYSGLVMSLFYSVTRYV